MWKVWLIALSLVAAPVFAASDAEYAQAVALLREKTPDLLRAAKNYLAKNSTKKADDAWAKKQYERWQSAAKDASDGAPTLTANWWLNEKVTNWWRMHNVEDLGKDDGIMAARYTLLYLDKESSPFRFEELEPPLPVIEVVTDPKFDKDFFAAK